MTTLGFESIPDSVRDLSLQGLEMLQTANTLTQPWEFETVDGVVKSSDFVLSERQMSFDRQRRYALEHEVKYLKRESGIPDFEHQISEMKYDINVLRMAIVDLEGIVANLTQKASLNRQVAPAFAPQASQLQPARMQFSTATSFGTCMDWTDQYHGW
jgi:hypothetical protein